MQEWKKSGKSEDEEEGDREQEVTQRTDRQLTHVNKPELATVFLLNIQYDVHSMKIIYI